MQHSDHGNFTRRGFCSWLLCVSSLLILLRLDRHRQFRPGEREVRGDQLQGALIGASFEDQLRASSKGTQVMDFKATLLY
jgi:hypothetical protein